ncbi:MAG: hypothetical protein KAX44_03740 [Candidatus Brocadiae bacterium]|nr:hypothetical protein [Candidatus Brocadiia bacterium]
MVHRRICVVGTVAVALLLTACGGMPRGEADARRAAGTETLSAAGSPSADRAESARTARSEREGAGRRRWRRRQDAGDLIAEALAPVDEMIQENGVSFRASHFAEDCGDWPAGAYAYRQGHASRFAFALEAADGTLSEYCLCAARGPDGVHGLYVSVCESHTEDEPQEGGGVIHRVVIDRIYLVKPNALSLALRAQMLDEVSQGNFMRAYRRHMEEYPEGAPEDTVVRPWLPSGGA